MHVIKFKRFAYRQKKFKQTGDLFLQSITTNIVLQIFYIFLHDMYNVLNFP